jgi:hypothetical protein
VPGWQQLSTAFLSGCTQCHRDLSTIGDTVAIGVTKDGVRFSTSGDIGSANVTLRCVAKTLAALQFRAHMRGLSMRMLSGLC